MSKPFTRIAVLILRLARPARPAWWRKTLAVLRRHRVRTLGVQAGRVLLLEQPQLLAQADRMGLAVEAVESGLPHAPVFPLPD